MPPTYGYRAGTRAIVRPVRCVGHAARAGCYVDSAHADIVLAASSPWLTREVGMVSVTTPAAPSPVAYFPMLAKRLWLKVRSRTRATMRAAVVPPEVLLEPGSLLDFPHEYSYMPPTLLAFGRETGDRGVSVGRYSSISGGTRILLGGHHHPEWVSTYPFRIKFGLSGAYHDGQPFTKGRVIIGSDVWIGYDVIVLSGVHIGHGAVVATGSVVTKDVPPYTMIGGNPARPIRKRFDDDTITALLRIAWWDWPHEKVLEHAGLLSSPDIQDFIRIHGR